MFEAVNEFKAGHYTECIELCTQEIDALNEFYLEALNLRGSLCMLTCQYQLARVDFERLLEDPKSSNRLKSNTYIKLTALNLQVNNDEEAFKNYDEAISIDPSNEDICK